MLDVKPSKLGINYFIIRSLIFLVFRLLAFEIHCVSSASCTDHISKWK